MDLTNVELNNASRDDLLHLIAELRATNAALQERVKELEDRLAQDSHNSSKPPSSDNPRPRRTRSLRAPTGRKPGGQPGHPGQTLRLVETPDRVIAHRPQQCAHCGAALAGAAVTDVERRQVIDLPPLSLEVVEHCAEHLRCAGCGHVTAGVFPPAVTQPVQYGPHLQALGVYLQTYQLLPYDRTHEMMEDLFGAAPSPGTLQTAMERCASALGETAAQIKRGVRAAEVVHFDESGMALSGRLHWLHVASTPTLTYYACHPKRGKAAMDEMDILPKFGGWAVHDGWRAYLAYAGCRHGLCNAHHLRELTFIAERDQQPWATEMKDLLRDIKACVAETRAAGEMQLAPESRHVFEQRYQDVLAEGLALNPPLQDPRPPGQRGPRKQSKARNLLERLRDHQPAVLAFMHDFRVPFDNSLAERDIRMLKVQQKISGCFRSHHGATAFCRIRSYLSSLRKQDYPLLAAIERAFEGKPMSPVLQG